MVRAPEPDKIPINSPHDLSVEVDALVTALQLVETEDTWEKINRAVKRFQAAVRGGACRFTDDFVHHLRDPRVVKGLVRSLVTERTALSGTALELVASCTRLGHHFAALVSLYVPTLLRLFARPNKVYVTRSASCVASIIRNTRIADVVRLIALEWRNEPGKSATFREQAAAALAIALGADGDTLGVDKDGLERRIDDLEWLIKTGATGREATVRSEMKKCWEVYKREWPDRVASFTAPMTPTIRKYLKVTDAMPGATSHGAVSRPPPRKPAPALGASAGPASHHAPTRPTAPALSKSHGPPSMAASHGPSRSTVSHSTSAAAPRSHALAASTATSTSTADSLGHGPAPSLRAARVDHSRSASASTMPSTSRSTSRCDERDPLAASTSSARSGAAVVGAPARSGFKPTAPGASAATATAGATAGAGKSGQLGGASRPAIRSVPSTSSTTSAAVEPRKARRVAPPVAAPSAAAEPAAASAPTARAQTLARSTGPGGTSAAPLAGSTTATQHKPFRPKLNASVAAAATPLATSAKPRPARAPAPPPPAVPTSSALSASTSTSAPAPAPAPTAAPLAAPRPPRAAAAATAGTASSRAAAAGAARTAPSAATLASRERRAAREAARAAGADEESVKAEAAAAAAEEEKDKEERRRAREHEREEEERQRVRAEEASRVAVEREERERAEREQERARAVPLPLEEDVQEAAEERLAAAPIEVAQRAQDVEDVVAAAAAEMDVEEERGMHSEMVLAESQATDAGDVGAPDVSPDVEQSEPIVERAVEQVERADTPAQQAVDVESSVVEDEEPASLLNIIEAEPADDSLVVEGAPAPDEVAHEDELSSPVVAVAQDDEPAHVGSPPALVAVVPSHDSVDDAAAADEHSAARPAVEQSPVSAPSPVRARAPSYDALPPSPLLASASVQHNDEVSENEVSSALGNSAESPSSRHARTPSSASARTPRPDATQPALVPAFATDSAPRTPFLASSPAPTSTPAPVTRPALPPTPATATPARPSVRFPASTLQYSPEPWQTASIMLDTPPRLDDLPGVVRLPGARVALPGVAPPVAEHEESDDGDDVGEDAVLPASPLARKVASPSPAPRSERPQAVFLDDYQPASPHDDVDTTFEADESLDSVDADASEEEKQEEDGGDETSLAGTERAAEPSPAASSDARSASYESSRLYFIPLHDASAFDDTVRTRSPSPAAEDDGETEYDDSSVDEAQASAETTRMGRSPERGVAEEPVEEVAASTSSSTAIATTGAEAEAEDPFRASPASPDNSSTTQDFSFFGAPVSSTPSSRSGALAAPNPWDMSLLGDESACFELERTQLRFHDETESEHEASSMAGTALALADVEVDVEPRGAVRSATPPGVLQRSLRNRVVTVDLQTPAAASKPLTRSTRSAARGVLGELQY
ncbi:uncharacterized protein RHOBADRAFT_45015 [Rhodotorula graminis WP1]|uniref:CLASP N-terminal domain-containing protein n=1 Tax=Rhodotorula graminis (strain WP1) TaxID=578459 RepID=A0A194S533_RHOGW|nr:uncharacterized protein RHOBADRAFT_45015 [Rhodotorula graminis WP1]KPV74526.1 hypothetical protein RHOBADRAFT_45015 [Rhodotorula graminis WP1]